MKRMKPMVIAILLLLGISGAAAQSLGDYAREVRKNKAEPSSTSRHYDNDNLPASQSLSVVGPTPAADADAAPEAADAKSNSSGKAVPADPAAAAERQKAEEEWKKKLEAQQEKLDSLNRDLDVQQREYRLRVATQYNSEGTRLQNAAQWSKEDEQFRNDAEAKQKAINTARQELDELQEQARKAGVAGSEKDKEKDKDVEKENDDSTNNSKDNVSNNVKTNDSVKINTRDSEKDNTKDNDNNSENQ